MKRFDKMSAKEITVSSTNLCVESVRRVDTTHSQWPLT